MQSQLDMQASCQAHSDSPIGGFVALARHGSSVEPTVVLHHDSSAVLAAPADPGAQGATWAYKLHLP